jgi:hypothetical protein
VGDPFSGWVRQPPVCDRDRMARDYADGAPAEPQVRPAAPRAGHGTVFVNRTADGTWAASWQDGPRVTDVEGERAEVIGWTLTQPAAHRLVFSLVDDGYVPLAAPGDTP